MAKRKILIIIMVLFLVVGCGSKKQRTIDDIDDTNTVILEGISYTLDQEDEEYGIKYKVASNFRKTTLINAINYYSEDINDRSYFVIRLFKYNKKDIDYVKNDIAPEYDSEKELTINGLDYTYIHFTNYTKADVDIFIHNHNDIAYAITFTSGVDMSRLEDIFLTSIEYDLK